MLADVRHPARNTAEVHGDKTEEREAQLPPDIDIGSSRDRAFPNRKTGRLTVPRHATLLRRLINRWVNQRSLCISVKIGGYGVLFKPLQQFDAFRSREFLDQRRSDFIYCC